MTPPVSHSSAAALAPLDLPDRDPAVGGGEGHRRGRTLAGLPRPSRRRLAALLAVLLAVLVLAGVVPLPDLEGALAELAETLGPWTYVLVAVLAFLETGAFVGLVVAGETAVVLGGTVAVQGEVSLAVLLPLAWAAAAAGDSVSFAIGRRLGRPFLIRRGGRLGITPARLARVESFYARHGGKAVLIGRFIGLVRAVAPFLAGSSGMRYRRFLPYSLLGTGLWSTAFTLIGYVFWRSFSEATSTASRIAVVLAVAAAAAAITLRHLRSRGTRAES